MLGINESSPVNQKMKLINILTRPEIGITDIMAHIPIANNFLEKYDRETLEEAEILIKYAGYIGKENENADKLKRLEDIRISDNFDFSRLASLSTEARQKLAKVRPATVGQASRISGVSPSDVSVLLVYLGR